jgi:hypothetical protein
MPKIDERKFFGDACLRFALDLRYHKFMKLRLRGNSVRLRLTRSEIERFAETGKVEETVEFGIDPPQKFSYALEASENAASVSADFENSHLRVLIPRTEAEQWTGTNQTGIEAEQLTGENRRLRILIEKDFACLEPRAGEDDADTFPHPLEGGKC